MDAVLTTPLVERQHGVVSTAQLKAAGMSKGRDREPRAGRLAAARASRRLRRRPCAADVSGAGCGPPCWPPAACLATAPRPLRADLMRPPAGPIDVTVSAKAGRAKGSACTEARRSIPSMM